MADLHVDPFPDDTGHPDVQIGTLDNLQILEEIRVLARQMCNAIVNSHRQDRSKNLAKRKCGRITTGATIMLNRTTEEVIRLNAVINRRQGEIGDLRERSNQLQEEYQDLNNHYNNLRQTSRNMVTRLDEENHRLRVQIGILRIQNQWRQFRLLNPPPVIHPLIQQTDQTWLLFH